jgi:glycosyltransferase involved in cell wall biosynthesis
VIEESQCGLVIEQGDSAGLVKAIETLHADPQLAQAMGRRAREVFERTFTRSLACERWLRLLQQV